MPDGHHRAPAARSVIGCTSEQVRSVSGARRNVLAWGCALVAAVRAQAAILCPQHDAMAMRQCAPAPAAPLRTSAATLPPPPPERCPTGRSLLPQALCSAHPPARHARSTSVKPAGRSTKLELLQLPGMESALTLGSADQQLGLRFKKLFLSDSDVGLKVRAGQRQQGLVPAWPGARPCIQGSRSQRCVTRGVLASSMLAKAEAGSFSFRLVAGSRRSTACIWAADRVLLHAAERAQCCSLPVVVAWCIACTAIGRGCSFHNCGSTTVPNNALLQVKGTLNTVPAAVCATDWLLRFICNLPSKLAPCRSRAASTR